jgi:hypothetical protein
MQTNANQIASSIATLLFEGLTLANTIGHKLRELLDSVKQDLEAAGKLIGSEWNQSEYDRQPPISLLCRACQEADLSKDEARLLMRSANLVSRQRVKQVLDVVYDNNKEANKGSKDRQLAKAKAEVKLAKAEVKSAKADKQVESAKADKPDIKSIIASLKAMPSISKADAIQIANIIKAKLA